MLTVLFVQALTATGFIWVRYSLVITPINYSLAAVCSLVFAKVNYIVDILFRFSGQLLRWSLWFDAVGTDRPVSFSLYYDWKLILIYTSSYRSTHPEAAKSS